MPVQTACICGAELNLPANQSDVKCEKCSRMFNFQGKFLWREGKDGKPAAGQESGEQRSEDQIAAAEAALEAGVDLEPKRFDDTEILQEIAETETAGATTGNVDGGADSTEAPTPASPKRGEQTHKHAKGEGHKPFKRSK